MGLAARHMGVRIAAAQGAEVTVLSRSRKKEQLAIDLGASEMLSTTEDGFFAANRGRFDLILNTISADIDVDAYLSLLRPPRGSWRSSACRPRSRS